MTSGLLREVFKSVILGVIFCVTSISADDGCYKDFGDTRKLNIFGSTVDPESMTVSKCVKECELLNHKYAGIENGQLCYCGDTKPTATLNGCTVKCSGDNSANCGGISGNVSVYSLKPSVKSMAINFTKEIVQFEIIPADITLTAARSSKIFFSYSDGRVRSNGFQYQVTDAKISATLSFILKGTQVFRASVMDEAEEVYTTQRTVQVEEAPLSAEILCPPSVNVSKDFQCEAIVRTGEDLEVTVEFEPGKSVSFQSANTKVQLLHPARGLSTGQAAAIPNTMAVLWNEVFQFNATLKGVEFIAAQDGLTNVYIIRPVCKSDETFCARSYTCLHFKANCDEEESRWEMKCDKDGGEMFDMSTQKCIDNNGTVIEKSAFSQLTEFPTNNKAIVKLTHNVKKGSNFIPANVAVQPGDAIMTAPGKAQLLPGFPGETLGVNAGISGATVAIGSGRGVSASRLQVYPIVARPFTAKVKHRFDDTKTFDVKISAKNANVATPVSNSTKVNVLSPIENVTVECPNAATIGKAFTCKIPPHPGSDVTYDWNFGRVAKKNITATNYTYTHTVVKLMNITVVAYNDINRMAVTVWIHIQKPVRTVFITVKPLAVELGEATTVTWRSGGTNVSYVIDFGDGTTVERLHESKQQGARTLRRRRNADDGGGGGDDDANGDDKKNDDGGGGGDDDANGDDKKNDDGGGGGGGGNNDDDNKSNTEAVGNTVSHTFKEPKTFNITVNASNLVSSSVVSKEASAQIKIAGLAFTKPLVMPLGKDKDLEFSTTNGTHLTFKLVFLTHMAKMFPVKVSEPYRKGYVTAPASIFSRASNYTVTLNGKNGISVENTAATVLRVEQLISPITAEITPKDFIKMNASGEINVKMENGTSVLLTVNYGEGLNDSKYIRTAKADNIFKHTFTTGGEHVLQITAENPLNSESTSVKVIVEFPVAFITLNTSGPGQLLPGRDVVVTVKLILQEGKPNPTDATYELSLGEGDLKSGNLDFSDTKEIIHTKRCTNPGNFPISVNMTNRVSQVYLEDVIIADEPVENLKIVLSAKAASVGDEVSFTISMTWGSRVNVTIDFQDGTESVTLPLMKNEPKTLKHTFNKVGNFNVTVTSINGIGPQVAAISNPLPVVSPIDGIFMQTPTGKPVIKKDIPYEAEVFVKVEKGKKIPTHLEYSFDFDDGSGLQKGSNPITTDATCTDAAGCDISGPIKHQYTQGGSFDMSVIVWNAVSRGNKTHKFDLYGEITGLEIAPEVCNSDGTECRGGSEGGNSYPDYEPITMRAVTTFGSHITYEWNFGDEGAITLKENNTIHRYQTASMVTRKITLKAHNPAGSQASTEKTVKIYRAVGEPEGGFGCCAIRNYTTVVTLDQGNKGYEPCYFFDFADTTPIMEPRRYVMMGVESECRRRHPKLSAIPVIPLDGKDNFLRNVDTKPEFDVTFQALGRLVFTFIASNIASEREIVRTTAIAKGPCYLPLVDLGQNRTIYRSDELNLLPSVVLNCTSTNLANYTWHIYKLSKDNISIEKEFTPEDFPGQDIELKTSNMQPRFFNPRTFEYGVYKFTLNVSMWGEFGLWTEGVVIVAVTPTPLRVHIDPGKIYARKWGVNFTIDAYNSTYDLDIEDPDEARSKLTYQWMCRRYCETFPVYDEGYEKIEERMTSTCVTSPMDLQMGFPRHGCFPFLGDDAPENEAGLLDTTTLAVDTTASSLYIPGMWLREPPEGTIVMKLIVSKDDGTGRVGSFTQQINITKGDPPDLQITCVCNCKRKVNPSNKFSLSSKINNRLRMFSYEWKWQLVMVEVDSGVVTKRLIPESEWALTASTGTNTSNIAINSSPYFKQFMNETKDREFELLLKCRRVGTEDWGLSSYSLVVNRLPSATNITCTPDPPSGMAVRDRFNIKCNGSFEDEDLPFTYSFAYRVNDDDEIWLGMESSPFIPGSAFIPNGDEDKDYIVSMVMRCYDAIGGYTELILPVEIVPPDEPTIRSMLGNWDFIERALKSYIGKGNIAVMCQLTALYGAYMNDLREEDNHIKEMKEEARKREKDPEKGDTLNTAGSEAGEGTPGPTQTSWDQELMEEEGGLMEDEETFPSDEELFKRENKRKQHRKAIIVMILELKFQAVETIAQVNSALGSITEVKEELEIDTLGEIVKLMWRFIHTFTSRAGQISSDRIEMVGKGCISILGEVQAAAGYISSKANVLIEKLTAPDPTGMPPSTPLPTTAHPEFGNIQEIRNDPAKVDDIVNQMADLKAQAKGVVMECLNMTTTLLNVVQSNMVAGESPIQLKTKSTTATCTNQFTESINKEPVSLGGPNKFVIPPAENLIKPTNDSTLTLKGTGKASKDNAFTWGNKSDVTSPVVALRFADDEGEDIKIQNTSVDFHIEIQQPNPQVMTFENYTSTENTMVLYSFNVEPTMTLIINVINVNDTWGDEFRLANETDANNTLDDVTKMAGEVSVATASTAETKLNGTRVKSTLKKKKRRRKKTTKGPKVPDHMLELKGVDDIDTEVKFVVYVKLKTMVTSKDYDLICTLPLTPNNEELGIPLDEFGNSTEGVAEARNATDNTTNSRPKPVRDLNTCMFDRSVINVNETTQIFFGVKAVTGNLTGEVFNMTDFIEVKYRLSSYLTACQYFDTDIDDWSCDGCRVTERTTPLVSHCACNHLTNFGSAFAVPMNPIDLSSPGFGDLNKNPTVFATFVSSVCMFFVLLIWAIKADRIDEMKAGATPLPDNDPRDKYLYELLVTTGDQPNAGTTAQVSFILSGEDNETEPRVLMDERRKTLQKGDVDTFILAVPAPLGPLTTLRIWHDNSGKAPQWYFFQIQVTDLQSKEKNFFICDRWLAMTEDDGLIDRVIPVAGFDEMTDFNYLFWTKARKDLTDGHIWISVFKRPPKSKFTRVQRLTCCLLLLYTSMLSSLMFFGTEPENPVTLNMGPIKISLYTVQVGIISGLVVVPINILIVFLFQKSKDPPKDLCKKKSARIYSQSSRSSLNSIEIELTKEKEFLETGKRNLESASRDPVGPGVTYIDNEGGVPRVTLTVKEEKPKKKPFMLPWQTLIAAYFLVAFACSTSFYFAVKFGQGMGFKKTVRWISAFSMGIIQSVIVQEPVKIVAIAAVYAIVLKKPDEGEETEFEPEDIALKEDEEFLHDYPTEKEAECSDIKEKIAKYKVLPEPPDEQMLKEVRQQRSMEKKSMSTIWGLIFYIIYLCLLAVVALENRDPRSNLIYENMKNIYNKDMFTLNTPITSNPIEGIKTHESFWKWAIYTLVPGTYGVKWTEHDPTWKYRHFIADRVHFRVGPVRIRQVRQKDEPCEERVNNYGIGHKCRLDYSIMGEDEGAYRKGWIPVNKSDSRDLPDEGWEFKGAIELRSAPRVGLITTYGGGGYTIYLGDTAEEATRRLEEHMKYGWIDKRSRGVHVEFLLYNPTAHLYWSSQIIIEFMVTGAAVPFYEAHIMRLVSGSDPNAMGSMLLLFLFFGFILYFFVQELKKMKLLRRDYFRDFWNNYEFTIIVMSTLAILMSIGRFMIAYDMGETMKDRSKFLNMAYVILWDQTAGYLIAFIAFLSILKCLRLLRFNKDIAGLFAMMNWVAAPLADFMVVFMIMFTSFCMICYMVFNPYLSEYRTYITSMETLLSMMLNKFDANRLTATSPFLGSCIFILFVLAINITLINFMLAIIMEAFVVCSEDIAEQNASKDHEIVDFMISSFKKAVGLEKGKSSFHQECKLRYIEGAENSTDEMCETMVSKVDLLMEKFESYLNKQADSKEIMQELEALNKPKKKKKKRVILTS